MTASAQSALGILILFFLVWSISEKRQRVPLTIPIISLGLQIGLALLLLRAPLSQHFFSAINSLVLSLEQASRQGTSFVFGYLGGDALPFQAAGEGSAFVLAFQALPLIIFLSALTALLNHWNILPRLILALARLLSLFIPLNGATGLACIANIFVGMVESPLFIKPYLQQLSRSDLFIVMTVGMATIAGTVMVIYVGFLNPVLGDAAAGHLMTASVISIPAAIGVAIMMVPPETPAPALSGVRPAPPHTASSSSIDALVTGTQEGLQLCLQIAALLIVFVALIALFNLMLGAVSEGIFGRPLDLQTILGYLMSPIVWLSGIPWDEAQAAGKLFGTKIVLNEFIALRELGSLPTDVLSARSTTIMTYALSGFANIGSLGILIGGLTAMAPARRAEIIQLAPKAILSGSVATLLTGAVIGLVY